MASELGHRIVSEVDYVLISKRVCECKIDWVSNFATWCKLVLGIASRAYELVAESYTEAVIVGLKM